MMHFVRRFRGVASTPSIAVLWLALLHAFCERAAAEAVEVFSTAEGKTELRQPDGQVQNVVVTCIDEANTGVRFHTTGSDASCHDLINYCNYENSSTIATHIQESCAKTCGRCGISDNRVTPGLDPGIIGGGAPNCSDQAIDAKPVFTVADRPAACTELKAFCHGHPDSEYVMQKCGHSCGLCPAVYTQGVNYARNCPSRRRFGFCATRRRNFRLYEGGGIVEDTEDGQIVAPQSPALPVQHSAVPTHHLPVQYPVMQHPVAQQRVMQHPAVPHHAVPVQHHAMPVQHPPPQYSPIHATPQQWR